MTMVLSTVGVLISCALLGTALFARTGRFSSFLFVVSIPALVAGLLGFVALVWTITPSEKAVIYFVAFVLGLMVANRRRPLVY